jgi:ABC-type branched-subunit amino acid transport system substrate-binding protein
MKAGWKKAVAVIAAATICAAACSSGGSKSSGGSNGSATSAGHTTRGVTATSIDVGVLAVLSTPLALTGFDTGVKAAFAPVNAAGGIDGRRINVTAIADDGANASTDLAAAQKLVLQDKVFAIAFATQSLASATFLEQQHVPTVGWDISPQGCYQSYIFGIDGCLVPSQNVQFGLGSPKIIKQLLPAGAPQTVAVTLDDTVAGRAAAKQCTQPFTDEGFKVVASPSIPTAGVSDYSPYAQQIMTADGGKPPSAVFECSSAGSIIGIAGALQSAGYKGLQMNGVLYDPRLLLSKQLAASLNDTYVENLWDPYQATTPAIEQMVTNLKAEDPNVLLGLAAQAGYWTGELLVAMLQKAGPNLTAESLVNAVNGGFSWGVAGGICPESFPAAHASGSAGAGAVELTNDHYTLAIPVKCDWGSVPEK